MNQKRVLIFSTPDDIHAAAVAYAIRLKGHICECIYTPDIPTLTSLALRIPEAGAGTSALMQGPELDADTLRDGHFDTIWLRRRPDPLLPEDMHPGDQKVALKQCRALLRSLLPLLDHERTFWVNHYTRSDSTTPKPLQLAEARKTGLLIPETLITNDPVEIRRFVKQCGGRVAHKLLEPAAWVSEDEQKVFMTYTSVVEEMQLPDDDMLRMSPAIYQRLLAKKFEVRIACLGDQLVALKLNSQADQRAATDWRAGQFFIDTEPYEVPQEVAARCRCLLKRLGLAHASMDFVVDPEDRHIFLEANPQGQFLWMEYNSGLPLLDMFSEFLLAKTREFCWKQDHDMVSLSAFQKEEWGSTFKKLMETHRPNTRRDELIVSDAAKSA